MVGWKSGTTALVQYILQTQRCLPCTVCCVGRKPANQKTLCTDLQSALNRDVTAAVLCGRGRCESYLKRNSLLWDEWWTRCVLAVWMYGGAVGRGTSNKHTHIGSFLFVCFSSGLEYSFLYFFYWIWDFVSFLKMGEFYLALIFESVQDTLQTFKKQSNYCVWSPV